MIDNYNPVIGEIENKNGKNIWKIENYSTITNKYFYSPVFTTPTPIPNSPLLRWQLGLYPNLNNKDNNYIEVYVFHLGDFEVTTFLSISLLNNNHERLLKRRSEDTYTFGSCDSGFGFPQFTDKKSLTREKEPFLIEDTLRVFCNFTFVNSTSSEESSKQLEHYKNLFDNGSYSDVTFVIEQHKLQLHKNILTGFSPVFQAMFEHEMKENKENVVTITDIKFDIMKELFRYMYLRQVQDINKNAGDLLIAADKYSVTGLKTLCEQTLSASLKLDNAINRLRLAILHNALYLKSKVTDFILNQLKDFIEREDFKKMDSSCNYELFKAIVQKETNK